MNVFFLVGSETLTDLIGDQYDILFEKRRVENKKKSTHPSRSQKRLPRAARPVFSRTIVSFTSCRWPPPSPSPWLRSTRRTHACSSDSSPRTPSPPLIYTNNDRTTTTTVSEHNNLTSFRRCIVYRCIYIYINMITITRVLINIHVYTCIRRAPDPLPRA